MQHRHLWIRAEEGPVKGVEHEKGRTAWNTRLAAGSGLLFLWGFTDGELEKWRNGVVMITMIGVVCWIASFKNLQRHLEPLCFHSQDRHLSHQKRDSTRFNLPRPHRSFSAPGRMRTKILNGRETIHGWSMTKLVVVLWTCSQDSEGNDVKPAGHDICKSCYED